jgi:hypothetical protein
MLLSTSLPRPEAAEKYSFALSVLPLYKAATPKLFWIIGFPGLS